jgi:hypothetical protein
MPLRPVRGDTQRMPNSYAVVWRDGEGAVQAGKLELSEGGIRLEGVDGAQDVRFADLRRLRVGRAADERLDGRRALLVDRRDGRSLQIATVAEVGSLLELAERIAGHEGVRASRQIVVVVPLRRGARRRVHALLAQGPPFDPEGIGLDRHDVFLTDREAVFVFETDAGGSVLETLLTEPRLWKAAAAWRSYLAGMPRVAEVAYSWERVRPATNGSSPSR